MSLCVHCWKTWRFLSYKGGNSYLSSAPRAVFLVWTIPYIGINNQSLIYWTKHHLLKLLNKWNSLWSSECTVCTAHRSRRERREREIAVAHSRMRRFVWEEKENRRTRACACWVFSLFLCAHLLSPIAGCVDATFTVCNTWGEDSNRHRLSLRLVFRVGVCVRVW